MGLQQLESRLLLNADPVVSDSILGAIAEEQILTASNALSIESEIAQSASGYQWNLSRIVILDDDDPFNLPPDTFHPPRSDGDLRVGVEEFQFSDGFRWSSTATDGQGLQQGDPTTLTWGFVADGTWIIGDPADGEPGSGSDLIAFLDGIYGNVTPDNNFTDELWFIPFNSYLNRWGEVSGLNYAYESNDDGLNIGTNPAGVIGTRGDIRISGHSIDGQSGSNVLAYNWYPAWG